MFLLKCLAAGAIAVAVGEIITRRALRKAEECADEIIENALDKAEARAEAMTREAVNHALEQLEAETGLPLARRNRRTGLIRRIFRRRREEAPNERHKSGSPQMA